jgi:hypothetical protein
MYEYEETYTPSVKQGRFCGSCGHGRTGWDEKHCSGCHGTPGKPHWTHRYHNNEYALDRALKCEIHHKFLGNKLAAALRK